MLAGKLRDRVTFKRRTLTDDGYGNLVGTFADHLTVWADVRETPGKERVAAGVIENTRTATIRIRKSPEADGLLVTDQVQARGVIWNVRGIANADRKSEMLDLLVETGVAQ
ncbi:MAG: phage head closure protein [Pseudomonadota bacterium]